MYCSALSFLDKRTERERDDTSQSEERGQVQAATETSTVCVLVSGGQTRRWLPLYWGNLGSTYYVTLAYIILLAIPP